MPTPLVALPWGSASRRSVRRSAMASEAAKIDGRRGFPDAALLIGDSDDMGHEWLLTYKMLLINDLHEFGELAARWGIHDRRQR